MKLKRQNLLFAACGFAMCITAMFHPYCVKAQFFSGVRYLTFATHTDSLHLDSLSVIPHTVIVRSLQGEVIDSSYYTVHPFHSLLVWTQRPVTDSVRVFFRVYPFSLAAPAAHKNYQAYRQSAENFLVRSYTYLPEGEKPLLIDFGNLEYNGSFSRGLSFGSNQSLVLNSVFNLQLSGMVTRDLEVTAAITDNNIPIQPEGNTQQIQEFDKIFIQLRKDRHKVIVGDFDLFNTERDYFMRFSKKYRGGSYSGSVDAGKKGVLHTAAAGGISRGKFARNLLRVTDGNQGPYKLVGAAGETFIIILANTEEVFVNGQKMERGADRDYIIDYNLGEITFMPRRIITKDLRVYVEFEYTEQTFLRSTAFAHAGYAASKGNVYFSFYSEQDSKNQNLQQSLNAARKSFLTTVGDSIRNAFYPGIDSVAFEPNRVLYALKDTFVYPYYFDSVLVYSTRPEEAKYAATFAFVGEGKGNYIPAPTTANGRVYQWVAPVFDSVLQTTIKRGSYEPVILLITPKYQQMCALGGEYRISDKHILSAEGALSNNDLNMYSRKDDKDNAGIATRLTYRGEIPTRKDTAQNTLQQIHIDAHYEFLQSRFITIERYRNIEFARDWNLNPDAPAADEHLAITQLQYRWRNLGFVSCRFKTFLRGNDYRGYENGWSGNIRKGPLQVTFVNSYLRSVAAERTGNYIRPKADISWLLSKKSGWRSGIMFDHEVNMLQNRGEDTLSAVSFLWQNYRLYFQTPDTAVNQYTFEYTARTEHHPEGLSFEKPHFHAHNFTVSGRVNTLQQQTLQYTLTYRYAKERDSVSTTLPEHFYLGRIDYQITALKGFLRSNTLYEIGTGRQQKTQLVYQLSPSNTGDYIWLGDINGNGVKDINEFGIKYFNDTASYVRVFVVTPEFVPVNTNQFNQSLHIQPAALWNNARGFKKFLGRFSVLMSVQLSKKTFMTRAKNIAEYFNPVPMRVQDEQLVSTAVNSRNSLYFNRMEARYGAQLDVNYLRQRTLLTTGFEDRYQQSQSILWRWNILSSLNVQTTYTYGVKANSSDFFKNLRYRFTHHDANLTWIYQWKTNLRFDLKYDFAYKANPTDTVGTQTGMVHNFTLLSRYNLQNKSMLDGSLSFATVRYDDRNFPNAQLEYAMLEGLRSGNNLVWQANFAHNLTPNIQLTIGYDGRMTGFVRGVKETLNPIHTGRAELRALF
ncbi:MAG: hypothetical protein NZM35_09345 [Chitinophagales bacterium]|nr:hypothetical protein [Chitinophagales bacterium]MDW8419404.1 hypothetical protein [Chitinophagales bacterium]